MVIKPLLGRPVKTIARWPKTHLTSSLVSCYLSLSACFCAVYNIFQISILNRFYKKEVCFYSEVLVTKEVVKINVLSKCSFQTKYIT